MRPCWITRHLWWTSPCRRQRQHLCDGSWNLREGHGTRLILPADRRSFSFWTRLIPSMMVSDGSGVSSAGETFFFDSLARAALLVLRSDPPSLASAKGKGPIGWAKTSLICSFLLSAMMTIWPNSLLSAFRTTSLTRPLLCGFFLMPENVFSFFFIIFSWNCVDGASSCKRSCWKVWYASSLSCRLQEGPWPLLVVPRQQLTS